MPDETRRERDLILAPNEYAFILDETKGNIVDYVGPHKTSLANTDQPVVFNYKTKRFGRCTLEQAIQSFVIAPEGWYVVLKNPGRDGKHATPGTANSLPQLDIGRKVNMPGPVAFAPWPGQMVRVIQGHHLRSNQYLLVRVYDEEAAKANWGKAVIKPQTTPMGETPTESGVEVETPDLTMGNLLVIKGTGVAFYIPPTGIEVVPDQPDQYVRTAVTLERLEYCILLDENGNKRFITGPDVVFPKPTETFVVKDDLKKFRAIELNENSGLYIKVIAPYKEGGKDYRVGDELFITGQEQMIYFPRPEHAIIRYGDREVHYGIAIPAGEARYVLDRLSGQITLKKGPCMFLPDPRKEVIVRRVLDPKQVSIWFPGNQEALEYNRRLMQLAQQEKGEEFVSEGKAKAVLAAKVQAEARVAAPAPAEEFVGDEFSRKQQFTPPRTITLDTKYDGAVTLNVWTGYATLVVSKTGERKVIVGPQTYLLEYDETLETIELSTGTPKSETNLIKTVYLRVLHNKVSDLVGVETSDLCPLNLLLSYRVNFEGEPNQWFSVENYVKFLTDHLRSLLRNAIKQYGIEEFYASAISIVRDTILGTADEQGKRPGRAFNENGMRIYDVEVLGVTIEDDTIAKLLVETQHNEVQQTLQLASEQRNLAFTKERESIKQMISRSQATTRRVALDLETEEVMKRLNLNLAQIESEVETQKKKMEAKVGEQAQLDQIAQAELTRQKNKSDLALAITQTELTQRIEEMKAEVEAVVNKAKAVSPNLIAALQAFSDKALAERMAESMAPLAILGGKSVADVLAQLLKGTVLESVLKPPALPQSEQPPKSAKK